MMVVGGVGVEIHPGAVDGDLPQQARLGELVKRIVYGRERHGEIGGERLLIEPLRRHMTIAALSKQQLAERQPLAGRPQASVGQQLRDRLARRRVLAEQSNLARRPLQRLAVFCSRGFLFGIIGGMAGNSTPLGCCEPARDGASGPGEAMLRIASPKAAKSGAAAGARR